MAMTWSPDSRALVANSSPMPDDAPVMSQVVVAMIVTATTVGRQRSGINPDGYYLGHWPRRELGNSISFDNLASMAGGTLLGTAKPFYTLKTMYLRSLSLPIVAIHVSAKLICESYSATTSIRCMMIASILRIEHAINIDATSLVARVGSSRKLLDINGGDKIRCLTPSPMCCRFFQRSRF